MDEPRFIKAGVIRQRGEHKTIGNQPKPVKAGGIETPTQRCPERRRWPSYPSLRWVWTYMFCLWGSRGADVEPEPREDIRPSLGNLSGSSFTWIPQDSST